MIIGRLEHILEYIFWSNSPNLHPQTTHNFNSSNFEGDESEWFFKLRREALYFLIEEYSNVKGKDTHMDTLMWILGWAYIPLIIWTPIQHWVSTNETETHMMDWLSMVPCLWVEWSGSKVETPYNDNDLIHTPIISPQSGWQWTWRCPKLHMGGVRDGGWHFLTFGRCH